jgi:hypothetical protein
MDPQRASSSASLLVATSSTLLVGSTTSFKLRVRRHTTYLLFDEQEELGFNAGNKQRAYCPGGVPHWSIKGPEQAVQPLPSRHGGMTGADVCGSERAACPAPGLRLCPRRAALVTRSAGSGAGPPHGRGRAGPPHGLEPELTGPIGRARIATAEQCAVAPGILKSSRATVAPSANFKGSGTNRLPPWCHTAPAWQSVLGRKRVYRENKPEPKAELNQPNICGIHWPSRTGRAPPEPVTLWLAGSGVGPPVRGVN